MLSHSAIHTDCRLSQDASPKGHLKIIKNCKDMLKANDVLIKNMLFGISRPRCLQQWSRFSIWSNCKDQLFWGTSHHPKINEILIPMLAFTQLAKLLCLPMDRSDPGPPDLLVCGLSCARSLTEFQFSSLSGAPTGPAA